MNLKIKKKLISIAKSQLKKCDHAHDFEHILRVLDIAEMLSIKEKADLDIIIPAALFHDIITYPKNTPNSRNAPLESALLAKKILKGIKQYPLNKIDKVQRAILSCSFSNNIVEDFLEAQIIQDADGLESTGAIAIMRTFSSAGTMQNPLMAKKDPFCKKRQPQDQKFALDLFFTRLLKIKEKMHTKDAKRIANKRTEFVKKFLEELETELNLQKKVIG